MSEMLCPNCGRHLVNYRTDRQAAGRREVELKWTICVHCRHVALDSWSFADGVMPADFLNGNSATVEPTRFARSERQQKRA